MVPLILHLVDEKHLDISGAIRRLCARPGEIYGIPKGKIAEGYDADFMVVDFENDISIRGDRLHSKCGWSAFEGMPAIFPKAVFVRGELVMENGEQVGERIGRDVISAAR
jgi:dihydroorotase